MDKIRTVQDLKAVTDVFPTLWYLGSERFAIFEKRLRGEPSPWTDDPILLEYKFTNPFRAADRVSQYLIRHVIYESGGSMADDEVIYRVLLFKLFNSIGAWEALKAEVGIPSWRKFGRKTYAEILTRARARGVQIWSRAYTQRPQTGEDHYPTKHERYLALLYRMVMNRVWDRLKAAQSYKQAYHVLRLYSPLFGPFTAMQILTDINYSPALNFDENDFIMPGPGCLDGMQKCFGFRPDPDLAAEIIHGCVAEQEGMFADLGLAPVRLFGRRLTAIDIQNLFCEVDKYARVAHPKFNLKRTEIKQFHPTGPLPAPYFPPKWDLEGWKKL
jgi:alpha-glutamyl/putrescinyl thymine pyrophosphorylase clade 1